jgi:hypothetical protein
MRSFAPRRVVLAAAAAVALAGSLAASTASADVVFPRVNLYLCGHNGAGKTVPSGTDLSLIVNWAAEGSGLTKAGVRATVLDVAINGVPIADTASYWGPLVSLAPDFPDQFSSDWIYPLGPVVSTFTVSVTWTFRHPVVDRIAFNENGSPFVYPAGVFFSGSCTVTVE